MTTPYENLNVTCADQYLLAARFYPAQTGSELKPILISPATGITMNFYNTFATWLAEQGHPRPAGKRRPTTTWPDPRQPGRNPPVRKCRGRNPRRTATGKPGRRH